MNKIKLLSLFILFSFNAFSQLSDSIVGMIRSNINSLYFCKIDIASRNVTTFPSCTVNYTTVESSCIADNLKRYYYCDGNVFTEIDPSAGTIISNTTLPIPPGARFFQIQFHICDSLVYGFLRDGNNYSFCNYSPFTGTFTIIASVPGSVTGPLGASSVIDHVNGIFYSHTTHAIAAIDIRTGNVLFTSLYITSTCNDIFGRIAYNCITNEIFGLTTIVHNPGSGTAYLSKVNPHTGQVTYISNPGWSIGYSSNVNCGSCINQNTGDYYYSTQSGTSIIEANTANGIIKDSLFTSYDIYNVSHFSSCQCSSIQTSDISEQEINTKIFYDYSSQMLHVNAVNSILIIYDSYGRLVFENKISGQTTFETNQFGSGIYYYSLYSNNTHSQGKFVK